MDCPECERLAEEERVAQWRYEEAANALAATLATLGPIGGLDEGGLEQWKVLDSYATDAYTKLRQAERRTWEHLATHGNEVRK